MGDPRSEKIVLVGPMGSGKSSVGKLVARQLGKPFYDSDNEVEKTTGVSIDWIFEKEGEEGFRERESEALQRLILQDQPLVLSVGGGSVLRESNRALLKQHGWVVYLNANINQQVRNTGYLSSRPLLAGKDRRTELKRLLQERDPLYRAVADCVIIPSKRKASTVQCILEAYRAA